MYERLVRVRGQLAELVTAVDPDAVSGPTARQWWAEFDRMERLAVAGKTLLARRLAATHRPERHGTKTAAEGLARKSGTSTGSAQDAVNISNRLPEQPKVEQALRGGELPPAQAALVSSAAAANPAEEARLVELASRVSIGELREECARVKVAADPDPEATNRRLHAQRQLRQWTDGEGFWTLHAKGTPQAGAAFNAAIQPIIDQLFNDARRAGRPERVQAYAFDALMHLAEHVAGRCDCNLTAGEPAGEPNVSPVGGDRPGADGVDDPAGEQPASADDLNEAGQTGAPANSAADPLGDAVADQPDAAVDRPGDPFADLSGDSLVQPADRTGLADAAGSPGIFAAQQQPRKPACGVRPQATVNPRYLALLRVDVEALCRGGVAGDELCEIAGVGPVPVSVARGLLGDAILKLVITNGVDVHNVTHLGRGATAAQRAALLWTNPTCSVQGCTRTRVENDHREPWADTRHTRLDELDPLCGFHHDLKTRLSWALVPGKGKRAFVPPDDPRHPAYRKPWADRSRPADRPRGSQRPPDRPPERSDSASAEDATTGRRPGARPRAPAAGQPDLFAEPQPP